MARALTLIAACAAFWLLTALPARHLWGDLAAFHASIAVLLCLVPAVFTLVWAGWTLRQDPQQGPLAVLGGSGVRLFAVLLVALVLYMRVPPFQGHDSFLFWVLGAYLYTLTVEVVLLLRGRGVGDGNIDHRA